MTSLVTLIIYFWAKINISVSLNMSKHNVCHLNLIRSLFGQRNKEYWVVFSSDSVSQKRSYRFGNLTDSHSHSLKKIDEVFLTLKKLPTHSDLEFSNMSNLDQ